MKKKYKKHEIYFIPDEYLIKHPFRFVINFQLEMIGIYFFIVWIYRVSSIKRILYFFFFTSNIVDSVSVF